MAIINVCNAVYMCIYTLKRGNIVTCTLILNMQQLFDLIK